MLYNNRLYPHPVLGIGDDAKGSIEVELRVSASSSEIEISPSFKIANDTLQNLIEISKAIFVSHLYCRGTMYREVFKTEKNIADTIKIASHKLNGEVEIDFFVCANEEITNYHSIEFNSDYSGYTFSIDKGDILAYAGKGKFYANKSPEDLKSISALMNIDTTGEEKHPMKLDYSGEKITILLCQNEYNNYQFVKGNHISVNILLSAVVLPALIEAFHFISSTESDEFSLRRWYKFLKEREQKSKYSSAIEMGQEVLQLPNNRSFETVIQLINSKYEN